MAHTPIDTLIQMVDIIKELDKVQSWIDHARIAAKTNQHVQLELDRQQSSIDTKREWVDTTMMLIAMNN